MSHGYGAMWVVAAFSVIALAVGIERLIAQWKFVTRARMLGDARFAPWLAAARPPRSLYSVGCPIASKIWRSCGLIEIPSALPDGSLRMNHCS